jgi:Zn ribbon nucleic-acid-binding protein
MKNELINKTLHYNMLACPHCSNLLFDQLHEYEKNSDIKTVACISCDYLGKRQSFKLLTLEQINNLKLVNQNDKSRTRETENSRFEFSS